MNRWIKTALLSGVSVIAMTEAARAELISATIALLSSTAFLSSGALTIAGLSAQTFLTIAGIAGSAIYSALNRPKIKPQEFKQTFSTGESSEINAIGRVRIGGLKIFGNTKDFDKYRLIAHCKGPISAIETHYVGEREVTVEPNGDVSSPPWVYGYNVGPDFFTASYLNIQSKIGDGTETAWPDLLSTFPSIWTAAHRVRGVAQSLLRYKSPGTQNAKFLKIYQNGPPDYERVQRCQPAYDPRDGTQTVDGNTTWKWSENGIINSAHILRTFPNFASSEFDWNGIGAQATIADQSTATLTGTEPLSRCWGIWPSESPRVDTMRQVLDSIGAEIVPGTDDKLLIRMISDNPASEIDFTTKHIVDITRRYGPEGVERPNVCVLKYYSPERNYDMAEIDLTNSPWARVTDEIAKYGEKQYVIELPFCPSASQAQRIARRKFALARADTGLARLNMAGLAAWGLSYGTFQFPDIETTELCAMGAPRILDDEGIVEIPFVVWPKLTAWNPLTDEVPAPEPLPDLLYETDLATPDMPIEAVMVRYADATREVRVRYDLPPGGTYKEAVYRTYDDAGLISGGGSMTEVTAGSLNYAWVETTYNHFSDPSMDNPPSWLLGSGWSVTGGYLVNTPFGSAQGAGQDFPISAGTWVMSGTMSDRTAGNLTLRLVGSPNIDGTPISVNGPFSQLLTNSTAGTGARFRSDATLSAKVDNVAFYKSGVPIIELNTHMDFRTRIFDADFEASYFSDPLNVPAIAISNAVPAAPVLTLESYGGMITLYRLHVDTVDLSIVRIAIQSSSDMGATWVPRGEVKARPGRTTFDPVDLSFGQYRAISYTSDGSASPASNIV